MESFLGLKINDVLKIIPREKVNFDIDFPFLSQESFGDLRIIMEKIENEKWFFVLSYENYQERR
jgi:hypothetical protein